MRKSKRMGIGLAVALIATPMLPATKSFRLMLATLSTNSIVPDNKTITFTGIGADSQDETDTVWYTAIKVLP